MSEIWKKYKLWISSIGFLCALVSVVIFLAIPLLRAIKNNSDEVQRKNIDNEMIEARISKIPEMEGLYESFVEKEGEMDVVLDSSREVDFIKKLETLAEETGNKIELKIEDNSRSQNTPRQTNSADNSKNKKNPEDIRANLPSEDYIIMQINLKGNYENFVNFLFRLENLDYYVNVLSFELHKGTEETPESARPNNAFSPNSSRVSEKAADKEILLSAINVAVYIKK